MHIWIQKTEVLIQLHSDIICDVVKSDVSMLAIYLPLARMVCVCV